MATQEKFTPDDQRKVTKKVWKGEKLFLHAARHLHLKDIAMKFHTDIPYCHQIIACTRAVWKKTNQREVIQKLRKVEQSFLYAAHRLDLKHFVLKFG